MKRNQIIAAAVVPLALLAIAVQWRANRSQADTDKANFQAQRKAMGRPNPQKMQAQMLEDLAKQLGLSPSQKEAVRLAQAGLMDTVRETFANQSLSRAAKMQAIQRANQESETKIKAALTSEQLVKYEARQQKMRERMAARRAGRFPGGPPPGGLTGIPMFGPPPGTGGPMGGPAPGINGTPDNLSTRTRPPSEQGG